jgi:hypothetical protein
VSTCAEPRSAHSSSRLLQPIGVDGKPTRLSNGNTQTASFSAAERFAQFAPFNRDASLFPQQRGSFAPLCDYPAWTKSTLRTLPNGIASTAPGRLVLNLLSIHELASGARCMPLTKPVSTRYAGVQTGGSRCRDSAAKESGSVPGTLDIQGKEARS